MNKLLVKSGSFIDGKWRTSDEKFDVINPANQLAIAQVDQCSLADIEDAINAASQAQPSWSQLTSHQRAKVLERWFGLIIENQSALAEILTLEQGKPLAEAIGEIGYAASFLQWFSEEGKRVYGDVIPSHNPNQQFIVTKEPVGVVAAITPWNFPAAMIMRKAAAALAAGCTFVVRPDAQTPLTALAIAELSLQAGIPDGVFNVVVTTEAQKAGELLTQHEKVNKFTFTGSTRVGKLLMAQAATTVKRVSMELGGNAPLIVFADADIDKAVAGAIASKYRNAGQTCICTNRILIDKTIAKKFTEKYVQAVSKLTVGSGVDKGVDVGPMINEQAMKNTEMLVNKAVQQGAKVLTGGQCHSLGAPFYQPTVITDVKADDDIAQQEIFGPVSPIIAFESEQEAITIANNTHYGLAAYFYTDNHQRVWRVAQALSFGMIGINETAISNAYAPFGGVKQSGFGREGSKYGLDDYLSTKYLCMSR